MENPDTNESIPAVEQMSAQGAPQAQVTQPAPQPASNAPQPDRSVKVPEYAVCMAGDATPIRDVLHAVTPPKKVQ